MGNDFAREELSDILVGEIRGIRTFRVKKGWLRGLFYPELWVSGENVAICAHYKPRKFRGFVFDPSPLEELTGHYITMPSCTCGFYAYFDPVDANDVAIEEVYGIVEAYGKVLVGDKGFRAAKARIVALIVPEPRPARKRVKMVLDNVLLAWLLPLIGLTTVALANLTGENIWLIAGQVFLGLAMLVIPMEIALAVAISRNYQGVMTVSSKTIRRLKERYPDAEIFYDTSSALDKYPLSEPPNRRKFP